MKPKFDKIGTLISKEGLDIELAEDEYEINRTQQALMIQSQYVQEALASLKVEQDKMKGQLDMMPKRIEDTLDGYLKRMQDLSPSSGPMPSIGGGGLINAIPEIAKLLGLGGPANVNTAMLEDLSNQFNAMTAFMWKQKLRQMRGEVGLPEHLPIEGMHLNP